MKEFLKKYRKIIVFLLLPVLVAGFMKFAVFLPVKRIKALKRLIPKREEKLKELIRFRHEYAKLDQRLKDIQRRSSKIDNDFDPEQWMKESVNDRRINVKSASCRGKICRLELTGADLEFLSKYIYELEKQDSPVILKKVQITNNNLLDVILQMSMVINGER